VTSATPTAVDDVQAQRAELRPDPLIEHGLDALLMLHADHEQKATTTTLRAVGSTRVNPVLRRSPLLAVRGRGPMRGRPASRRWGGSAPPKTSLGSLGRVTARHDQLIGFGHCVQKT
jgi:citrate synthase